MISFIHCIEGEKDPDLNQEEPHTLEQDAKIMVQSFRDTQTMDCSINILQPTDNHITEDTKKFFVDNGVIFTHEKLYNPQINTISNYTNAPITQYYYSQNIDTEYMVWTDLDIIFTQEIPEGFFRPTDKCVLSIMDINDLPKQFHIHEIYEKYLKDHIEMFKVDKISHYAHTWFVYAKTNNKFWKNYKDLTFHLLDIVHKYCIDVDIEHMCEEIASSILYEYCPDDFISVPDFFGENVLSLTEDELIPQKGYVCNNNTLIYHYSDISLYTRGMSVTPKFYMPNIRTIMKIIGVSKTLKNFNIKLGDLPRE